MRSSGSTGAARVSVVILTYEQREMTLECLEHVVAMDGAPFDVVVWDNRFTLHYAVRDYSEPRRMIRTSTCGERPIGPREYEATRESVPA